MYKKLKNRIKFYNIQFPVYIFGCHSNAVLGLWSKFLSFLNSASFFTPENNKSNCETLRIKKI